MKDVERSIEETLTRPEHVVDSLSESLASLR